VQPRTAELLTFLDRHHEDLKAAVDAVPAGRRERHPAEGRWSVANVVEHLGIVETNVTRLLTARTGQARATELGPASATPVVSESAVARYLDRERRLVSGDSSQPKSGLALPAAWDRLDAARQLTRGLVHDVDGLDVSAVSFPHPALGTMNFYEWVVFLGGHESRHRLQILEIDRVLASSS
jgi:hypothetical protein